MDRRSTSDQYTHYQGDVRVIADSLDNAAGRSAAQADAMRTIHMRRNIPGVVGVPNRFVRAA